MDKGQPDAKKTNAEPLRPVIAPIPESQKTSVRGMFLPTALEKLLNNAVTNRATEILIEREASRTRIRERIRGILITDLRAEVTAAECATIFDYASKVGDARSEDGLKWSSTQFEFPGNGQLYFCRLQSSETANFGLITIHIHSMADKPFNLTQWGMGPNQASIVEGFLGRSHGLVLFCGTDTDDLLPYIQSITKQLATPERHVIAVGTQVQAWFSGVEQMVSNGSPEAFSKMLKVAFRHEPDLVIAHPIEKKDQMDLCLSEAIRGRLVFARLYAVDVADALLQLLGMGVEPYLMGAGLIGVVAQRSLRLNCQKCQDKDALPRERLKELGIPIGMQPAAFFHGRGCEQCFKTGFDRETNIFEVLEMTDEVRNRLGRDMKSEALRTLMKSNGLMTLRQVAVHKAINGQTSLSEVLRVTP